MLNDPIEIIVFVIISIGGGAVVMWMLSKMLQLCVGASTVLSFILPALVYTAIIWIEWAMLNQETPFFQVTIWNLQAFGILPVMWITKWMLNKCMVLLLPISCGHRKVVFTGRSSVPLREIILTVDEEIPTEQDFQELKTNALPYLSDVQNALEKRWMPTDYFFAGSTVERFGIAMMISQEARCFGLAPLGSLDADLDVMFCCSGVRASFSGQDDLLVEPFISGREGFTGYAQLVYFTLSVEKVFVSSTLIRQRANGAVQNMPVDNLPSDTCCFGTIDFGPKVSFSSRGPTMKLCVAPLFEADFTICIHCPEW
ncbi:uncharacterized protein LOC111344575, partial [Stylophora pistillata]|uniref:uncharacterized protein LOC111344575 n=1 Tax=Stylophora pistillata TaxID=50429 RepID=UPI000C046688